MTHFPTKACVAALCACLLQAPAWAQRDFSGVEIRISDLGSGVYALEGAGGNLGLSIGEDGVFLVDDQYAPLSEKILAAIASLTDRPVDFVLNTHYHSDHTGGNEAMGEQGALIISHDNVRPRLVNDQVQGLSGNVRPAMPEGMWPVVTFSETMTFHYNGLEIHVYHPPAAHTDGDAIVHFRGADVIHLGDVFFNEWYPFIDLVAGGGLNGTVAAVDHALSISGPDTRFVAGHGDAVTGRAALEAYRHMLVGSRDRVMVLIAEGKNRDEVIAAKPSAEWDAVWGDKFITPDVWVGMVYDALTAAP